MPQRNALRRIDASSVQGEGAYIVVRPLRVGEVRDIRQHGETMSDDERRALDNTLLQQNVVEWNWVDDDGNLLPLPSVEPSVIAEMTQEEFIFAVQAITTGTLPNGRSG